MNGSRNWTENRVLKLPRVWAEFPPAADRAIRFLASLEIVARQPKQKGTMRLDQLLEQEDYLHSARLGGQSLRYVAELDGQWVALLSFSAPALQIKAREKWLGWTPRQRARRRLHQRLWTGEPRLLCRAR
ncbi:MAG: DUF4338 domain-containing protein, partial [Verrucomicrobia bacterium]|nr:DUF4338 domain-containing protein [Verrucomicrobiota bacterium]